MKISLILFAISLTSCADTVMGLTRTERLTIYGDIFDVAGHPEIGVPLKRVAKTFAKQPVERINP
jgi:hypothetical protein